VAAVEASCGALPAPAIGSCAGNANGHKCLAVIANPQTVAHTYTVNSTAKVIVERSIAIPAEARTSITATNSPPEVSGKTITQPDYCFSGPAVIVSWIYSDPNGDPQSAYQVQVDDKGSFIVNEVDSGKVMLPDTSYPSGPGLLTWNTTYRARVRVWDSFDLVSTWESSPSWKTPKHAFPLVNFTWSPLLNPSANQPIQFTDQTTFYDTGGIGLRGWSWLFKAPALTPSSTLQNPTYTYAVGGAYDVTETVTDKDGYSCSLNKRINIDRPIPVWKEVSPK
jgi:PKD repeat protein